MKRKPRILILTPTYTAGSGICVTEMAKLLNRDYEVMMIGLGEGKKVEGIKMIKIPYPSFESFNPKLGSNIFVNVLYQIPLQILGAFYLLRFRPDVVMSNGFTPILFSLPFIKILKPGVFVYYGSYLNRVVKNKLIFNAIKSLDNFVDIIFVLTKGMGEDLYPLFSREKFVVIKHWTDIVPVYKKEREEIRKRYGLKNDDFILLFVGRFCLEKGLNQLVKVINKCTDIKNIQFWFVGSGVMEDKVMDLVKKRSDVLYKGFVTDRNKLRELYGASDLLWSFADESYVAKPAIEGLTVGVPLIIPNTAGVIEKYRWNIKVKKDLIPRNIGWIVDDENIDEICRLIKKIVEKKLITWKIRESCIEYAKKNHTKKNMEAAVEKFKQFIEKNR